MTEVITDELVSAIAAVVHNSLAKLDLPPKGSYSYRKKRVETATYITYRILTSDSIIEQLDWTRGGLK